MNRPRNRQPRPDQGGRGGRSNRPHQGRPQPSGNVPSTREVLPGAAVSIVLKQDQSTGREVQGIVGDVLTTGNHPRGIKVRLTDGRVGRVQRMTYGSGSVSAGDTAHDTPSSRATHQLPPTITLADYLPDDDQPDQANIPDGASSITQCPVCQNFKGDEYAISRHVEEHFGTD